jgi:subtilisin family serine protease
LTNRGHGGTLGVLAGKKLVGVRPEGLNGITLGGVAPMRIVPLRIANSVVHFWTSSVAQGIDYGRSIGADVVSMSMGGLPFAVWAAAEGVPEARILAACSAINLGRTLFERLVQGHRSKKYTQIVGLQTARWLSSILDNSPFFFP